MRRGSYASSVVRASGRRQQGTPTGLKGKPDSAEGETLQVLAGRFARVQIPPTGPAASTVTFMKMRISITAWLWALVLLPTVPLLGFFTYSASQYAAERQRNVEARLADEADDLVSTADAKLQEVLGALTGLSVTYEVIDENIPNLYAAARRLQVASPTLAAVSLVNDQERVLFLTVSPLNQQVANGEVASLRETMSSGKPSLSKPFRSTVNNRMLVALNVPVLRDGKVTHCVRGVMHLEKLADLIRPQALAPDRIAGIFDRDGMTIARSRSPELYVGKLASPPLVQAIQTQNVSVWRGRTREGIDTLTVVRPIGAWQWSIGVSVPIETLAAPVRAEMFRFAAFAASFFALLAGTVFLLNRRITARLAAVVDDAARALSGHPASSTSTGIRELDDLRDSLARADIYRNAILQEVQQRTAELNRAQQQLADFAHRLDDNVERERLRLAREVHDQIGAIFTGVSMLIGGLPPEAMSSQQRASINEALNQGLATARRLTAELRPPLLDHLGLGAAVEDMALKLLHPAGIDVRVELMDTDRLTERQAIGCYRIIQEGVTNAMRHSGCRRFEVTGMAEDGIFTLAIEDDGVGIAENATRQGHYGMTGMIERARLMAGELRVVSQPGAGLSIRVSVPLEEQQHEPTISPR